MRLINTTTLDLEEFYGENVPEYAILSHTWEDEEVNFLTWNTPGHGKHLRGFQKINGLCNLARKQKLSHAWVDTCCIDKSSSAELTEAINSMFRYYELAAVCYVYFSDVSGDWQTLDEAGMFTHADGHQVDAFTFLAECRWFKRGWTLQELIAPRHLAFYGRSWNFLGYLWPEMVEAMARITGIEDAVLLGTAEIAQSSVATRMSWAAFRETTRVEDEAYCLLGIFGVNLPLLYGEGDKAFIRLQEEIIRQSTDHSIFAWNLVGNRDAQLQLLAPSPGGFGQLSRSSNTIIECYKDLEGWVEPYNLTNLGLQISLPMFPCGVSSDRRHAVLNCRTSQDDTGPIALVLRKQQKLSRTRKQDQGDSENVVYEFVNSRIGDEPPRCACEVRNYDRWTLAHEEDLRHYRKERFTIARVARSDADVESYSANNEFLTGRALYTRVLIDVQSTDMSVVKRLQVFPSDAWTCDRNNWTPKTDYGAISLAITPTLTIAAVFLSPSSPSNACWKPPGRREQSLFYSIVELEGHDLGSICSSGVLGHMNCLYNRQGHEFFLGSHDIFLQVYVMFELHMEVDYCLVHFNLNQRAWLDTHAAETDYKGQIRVFVPIEPHFLPVKPKKTEA